MTAADLPLLEIRDVSVIHRGPNRQAAVRAVNRVSLQVAHGEMVGLVGESGCGKTTLAHTVMGLLRPSAGTIRFSGQPALSHNRNDVSRYRRQVQMVFQDPAGALNPRLTIGRALDEVLTVHRRALNLPTAEARHRRRRGLLEQVGLDDREHANRYPHELSGGQRQRVGIARALAVQPRLLVADEPVSALDVSVQVQILNLLKDLNRRLFLAGLFIAHDLAVVRYLCNRVYVMRQGIIVESGPCDRVFNAPAHPYTAALVAAVPDIARGLANPSPDRKEPA